MTTELGGIMAGTTATSTSSRVAGPGEVAASGFHRDVGLLGLTMVSLGSIIGSGWLLGALKAASAAGPASLVSWLIGGFILSLLALVHAELGGAYPVAGGTARYPHFAFGSIAGFISGWVSWLGAVFLAPVEIEAALTYTNNKIPGLVHASGTLTGWGLLAASGLMVILTFVNIIGIRRMSESNTGIVFWKLAIPTITIIALFSLRHHTSNFHAGGGFAPYGVHGIFLAIPLGVVFSLQGFEQATQIGGEARNPGRDLPRAVISSMVIGVVVYTLLELVFVGALNPANLAHGWGNPIGQGNFGPYATLATAAGATWLAVLLYIDAFVSPTGTGLIYIGTSSRVSYALGRNRYLPPFLSSVDRRGVPFFSILLAFVIGEVSFLPFPSWTSLVSVITSVSALLYSFGPISLMALRKRDPDRERPYRLPFASVICPLSFAFANLIMYWAGWTVMWKLLIGLGIGAALFAITYVLMPERRPKVEARSLLWILPWLTGLATITALGRYTGGHNVIPFWWDLGIVMVFAIAIYYLAVSMASPADEVREALDDEFGTQSEGAPSPAYPS